MTDASAWAALWLSMLPFLAVWGAVELIAFRRLSREYDEACALLRLLQGGDVDA